MGLAYGRQSAFVRSERGGAGAAAGRAGKEFSKNAAGSSTRDSQMLHSARFHVPWVGYSIQMPKGRTIVTLAEPRLVMGDPASLMSSDAIAVVAHFDPAGRLDTSSRRLLEGLESCGVPSVLVTTAPAADSEIAAWAVPESTIVYARENRGYDFGSWAVALRTLPGLAQKTVILTNNSMIGPFGSLQPVLSTALSSDADLWAVTASLQIRPHLQSFFLRFAPEVLANRAIARHFRSVRHLRRKMTIVRKYEIGLSDAARRANLTTALWRSPTALGVGFDNPTTRGWKELLDSGYPFLKRTILHDERVLVDEQTLSDAVRLRYGVELADYLS